MLVFCCIFQRISAYLKLIHSLQFLQIRNQSRPVFQSLEKLDLELHHFWQVTKQNIQLKEKLFEMILNKERILTPSSAFQNIIFINHLLPVKPQKCPKIEYNQMNLVVESADKTCYFQTSHLSHTSSNPLVLTQSCTSHDYVTYFS